MFFYRAYMNTISVYLKGATYEVHLREPVDNHRPAIFVGIAPDRASAFYTSVGPIAHLSTAFGTFNKHGMPQSSSTNISEPSGKNGVSQKHASATQIHPILKSRGALRISCQLNVVSVLRA